MLGNEDRMKISTKGRYAVRVMLDLALNNNGECIKVKEIAARPVSYTHLTLPTN